MDDQLFFRETESAPQMYAARLYQRAVVIFDGLPFPGPRGDRGLYLFDVATGAAVSRIEVGDWHWVGGHLEGHFTVSAGREMFVAGLDDQAIRRWDLHSGSRIGVDVRPAGSVVVVDSVVHGGRTILMVGTYDGRVTCYDAESGVPVHGALEHPTTVWSLCAYQTGDRLTALLGDDKGYVWRWDPLAGEPPVVLAGRHGSLVGGIRRATVAGRAVVVTSSGDRTVRVWDAVTGEPISEWISPAPLESAGISGVEILGDELVVAYADAVTRVDPMTGESLGEARQFPDDVYGMCLFEVDGRPMLVLSSDMVYRLDPTTFTSIPVA